MAKKVEDTHNGVPALVVTPQNAPVVSGNFETILKYLQNWKKQVVKMDMTDENVEQVRLIKREAVAYRNSLSKIQTEIKRTHFNDPKAVFEARMGQLLSVVGEVEQAADEVLDREEQQRIEDINQALDHYKARFQEQYGLDDNMLARVEYKKQYYNKTDVLVDGKKVPSELAAKKDLERQFIDLKKEQDTLAAQERFITDTCKDEPRLNLQHWLSRLEFDDVTVIVEAINTEKQRLRELDRPPEATASTAQAVEDADYEVVGAASQTASGDKVVIGVPAHTDFGTDFPGRRKTMRIEIEYAVDQGDALTEYFANLKQYGIKVRPVKEEVAF